MYKHNARSIQRINNLTEDTRINIPGEMKVIVGEIYLFERVDEKTIKMTKIA